MLFGQFTSTMLGIVVTTWHIFNTTIIILLISRTARNALLFNFLKQHLTIEKTIVNSIRTKKSAVKRVC